MGAGMTSQNDRKKKLGQLLAGLQRVVEKLRKEKRPGKRDELIEEKRKARAAYNSLRKNARKDRTRQLGDKPSYSGKSGRSGRLVAGMKGHDKTYMATHEAAHAVVALLLGAPLKLVTIKSDEHVGSADRAICVLGHAINVYGHPLNHMGGEDWALMSRAMASLAGHMATIKLGYDEGIEAAGAEADYQEAYKFLHSITGDGDIEPLLKQTLQSTRLIVDMVWGSIELVASKLEAVKTMTGDEVAALLRDEEDMA
jgi:hypothetical protein